MVTTGLVVALIAYVLAWLRLRRRSVRFPGFALPALVAGIISMGAAVVGPLDTLADSSLAWHMLQHLILMNVCAPLFVFAAPMRLALASLPPAAARGLARILRSAFVRFLATPWIALLQMVAVMYVAHLSPLYEAALRDERIHGAEHLVFMFSAMIFWSSIFEIAPLAQRYGYPIRLLSIFMAMPLTSFLGFMMYVARRPWYAYYAANPHALADQMNAGAVMWIAGGGAYFVALLSLAAQWSNDEHRAGRIEAGAPCGAGVV